MSKRMKKHAADLHLLGSCTPNTRKAILRNADNQLVQAIAEAVWTILEGRVPLSPSQKTRLRKDETILRQIATKQRTPAQKRKVLGSQRGGAVLGFLFNLLKNLF
tara:strand:- start:399 stop:713 length:315 start_codon:yes stop_codon:yes gene_type:complete